MKSKTKSPRILYFDIESSPVEGFSWQKYDTNLLKITKDWELLSFAYKWEGDKKEQCISRANMSEKQLTKKLWQLFDSADILVAHNARAFDVKKSNSKFLQFKMNPPSPYKIIDTLLIARSKFKFTSNSLNDLAETLGLGKKEKTGGFDLWLGCMAGDKKSWAQMEKYNKKDVDLLQKVYIKLRAWATTHPNVAAMADLPENCPVCGSNKTQKRGTIVTLKTKKHRHQCTGGCGHWFTGKTVKQDK